MPSEARRLHPFTVVARGLRLARQLLIPAVLGGASIGDDLGSVVLWGLALLAIPSLLLSTAQWLAFRYRLEGDDLVVDSGVLARRRRVIPIERVQNVDLEQSALERLAGVAALRIETASGGRETEASLTVLAIRDAAALRADLLARRRAVGGGVPGPTTAAGAGEEPLLRLSMTDLAVAGATSNEAGLIAAGLATMLELAGRLGALERLTERLDEAMELGSGLGPLGIGIAILLLAIAFLVFGWLVSIVTTVVRFHGFTLSRSGSDLRREYGLLSRHHTTVPLARIQAIRIEETLLRRAFGLAALKIETAGAGPQDRQALAGGAEAYVPITRRTQVGPLLREVFEDASFEDVRFAGVAPPSRRREFVRLGAMVLAVVAGLVLYAGRSPLILLGLLAPAWLLASARFRARGWARAEGYILVRSGVLTRTTWVVPERKIQTLHSRETLFQRRWDLATLVVDTAAGGREARVVDLHQATARTLLLELARDAEAARRRAAQRSA
jgi:putative membrane protein